MKRGVTTAWLCLVALSAFSVRAHPMYFNEGSSFAAPYDLEATFEARYVVGELDGGGFDVYRLGNGERQPITVLLLAPLACGTVQPQLWLVGDDLGETPAAAPFALPEGLHAVLISARWSPISDFIVKARRGPGLEARFPDDEHYLVVRSEQPGSYILFTFGQDKIGGTDAGWEALARFNRCERLADDSAG